MLQLLLYVNQFGIDDLLHSILEVAETNQPAGKEVFSASFAAHCASLTQRMTYKNYTACAAPKKLFIVPGADHGMSCYFDKEGYEAAIKDFWKEFD